MNRARLRIVEAAVPEFPPQLRATESYQLGAVNRCPHCGSGAFHVGRTTAECGHCETPMPIAPTRHAFQLPTGGD